MSLSTWLNMKRPPSCEGTLPKTADIVFAACFRHQIYEREHVRALLDEFA